MLDGLGRYQPRREGEGVEPPRHCCSTVFETVAVANRLALPTDLVNKAPAGGFEPPPCALTGRRPTRWTTPVKQRFARRPLRESGDGSLVESNSTQWESNPRFRHGKAVGCRYIMGAMRRAELSKRKSTRWESNPRLRDTGAESGRQTSARRGLDDDGTGGIRTHANRLRAGHAAANTSDPTDSTRREWLKWLIKGPLMG